MKTFEECAADYRFYSDKENIENAARENPIDERDDVYRLNYAARFAVEAFAQGKLSSCFNWLFVASQALYWIIEHEKDAEERNHHNHPIEDEDDEEIDA